MARKKRHLIRAFLILALSLSLIPRVQASNGYEDYTSYAEVDTGNNIDDGKTSRRIEFTGRCDIDAYRYKDGGSGYYGDFEYWLDVKWIAHSGIYNPAFLFCMSNALDDFKGLSDSNEFAIGVDFNYDAGRNLRLVETYAGSRYWGTDYTISLNKWYYLNLTRSGTTFTMYVYDDGARTSLVATRTLTLHSSDAFRYLHASNTYNKGSSAYIIMEIEDLLLEPIIEEEAYSWFAVALIIGCLSFVAIAYLFTQK